MEFKDAMRGYDYDLPLMDELGTSQRMSENVRTEPCQRSYDITDGRLAILPEYASR